MAPPKFNKGEAVSSRMAIETKAISTTSANPKYKPRRPATDPEQIQELWSEVRKQKRGDMAPTTRNSSRKNANNTKAISSSETPSVPDSTAPTSKTRSIKSKNPRFNELCLKPRGISIDPDAYPIGDPCLYFHTEPSRYTDLAELEKSTLWLDTQTTFLEKVREEYLFMNCHNLCEAEYAFFAKEHLLKREPREGLSDNTKDLSQRFPRAERMLEFVSKPDIVNPKSKWQAPPLLPPFLGSQPLLPPFKHSQYYPPFAFDIRPDCTYWISLHAFNSRYSGKMKAFVHTPQDRMTCPYFTVEFKRDDTSTKRANDQIATFGALALYNRYLLRTRALSQKWTHEQECQLRHYALTITKSSYTFWCIRPKLKDGVWEGCHMEMITVGNLTNIQDVIDFVSWINEIHQWGLTKYLTSCQTDVRSLARKQHFRTSLGVPEKECTCGDSPDAAGTSEQETLHSARAHAGTEAAHSKPLAHRSRSQIPRPALNNGAALANPAKTAAEDDTIFPGGLLSSTPQRRHDLNKADGVAKPNSQTPVDQQTGDKDAVDDGAAADDRDKVLEDKIETLGKRPEDAYLLVVKGVDGQKKPRYLKLNHMYNTWCKKIGVKRGHRMWYSSVSKGPTTIIDGESSYYKMMKMMKTARLDLRLYVKMGNDNAWNSS